MTREREPIALEDLRVVPANEASWDDLQAVLGTRGDASTCQCQRFKLQRKESFASLGVEELSARLREQTHCGQPQALGDHPAWSRTSTSEPVGWCAVEPRSAYDGLRRVFRVPWDGRDEDKADATRLGGDLLRRRASDTGTVGSAARWRARQSTSRASVAHGRSRATRWWSQPGEDITWGELYVGKRSIFADAGYAEVHAPTKRRVVMRIDFS